MLRIGDVIVEQANYWLSTVVLEVRKRDRLDDRQVLYMEKYPAISIFHSPEMRSLQQTLDGRLKELQSKQQPFKKRA